MTVGGKQVDEGKLYRILGGLEKGVKNLETGQVEIKEEVASIKTNCTTVSTDFNSRLYDLENAPKSTTREVSLGAKGLSLKGYSLNEIGQKVVWLAIGYLVLSHAGVIPKEWVSSLRKTEKAIMEIANDEARQAGV